MNIKVFVCGLVLTSVVAGCGSDSFSPEKLQDELSKYVEKKDCKIGIAVIYNGDTISINGDERFPMLSVYKFPQAIAAGKILEELGITPDDSIVVSPSLMLPDTWSPMRDRYGAEDVKLPIGEVLSYSLMMSDNNACDVIFELIGGAEIAGDLINSLGYSDISIVNTEAEMNANPALCYDNATTPIAIACLMADFYDSIYNEGEWMRTIKADLELCETGKARIPAAAFDDDTLIGHKTGTGPRDAEGRIMAINDVGYVEFSCGDSYVIAVFISDSSYEEAETEEIISEISEMVRRNIQDN